MATSGTFNFNLDIDQVIQEATEMIGGENTLGHEPASARRSINLMLTDWQNRGVLLWSTEVTAVTVAASVTSYALSNSTVDALEVVFVVGVVDAVVGFAFIVYAAVVFILAHIGSTVFGGCSIC